MSRPNPLRYALFVVGEGSTGKTSLIRRFCRQTFAPESEPLGAEFAVKELTRRDVSSSTLTLQLWDIAGQERYSRMTPVYHYRAAAAVVCDVSCPATLDAAVKWKQDLDSKVFLSGSGAPVPAVLLMNKADLPAERPPDEELDRFCKTHGFVGWYLTSAKEDKNVGPAFEALVDHVVTATSGAAGASNAAQPAVQLAGPRKQQRRRCCQR